jgi:hypothetical protein
MNKHSKVTDENNTEGFLDNIEKAGEELQTEQQGMGKIAHSQVLVMGKN